MNKGKSREQVIKELSESGDIINLHRIGIISTTMISYRDIYYDLLTLNKKGLKKIDAVRDVSIMHNVSIQTVYKAVKWMKG